MSAISLKSITGITSITTPAGVDNQLTLHNNNTTEAVKLDIAGNLHFHNHLNITGVSTASNFKTGTSNLHNTGLNVQDLDVDGHTNLDNVSIAGVTTFSTSPVVPNGGYYKGIINSGSQQKIVGGYINGSDTLRLGESMYLTSTGLGINKSSPATKLHVVGGTASGTAYDTAVFAGGQNSTSGSGVKLYLSGCENNPTARGVILESIMTDNANAHRFSILVGGASAAPTERFRIDSTGQGHFYGNQSNAPQGIFGFRYDKNNDTDVSIENLNNSSVNNNAGIKLRTNHGNIKLRYFNNGGFYIQNSSDSGYLHYYEGSNSRFYVSTNGNIGINETSPQQLLHVHNDTSYQGILINGNGAPRIAFARSTTTTGEWSVGIDGTNGNDFVINNSNNNSNRMFIIGSAAGNNKITCGANTQINGNLIMASAGNGIDFSATANGGTGTPSELLDDYEEGYFAPEVTNLSSGYGSGTFYNRQARYTKVGNMVNCWVHLQWWGNAVTSGSDNLELTITGFPFEVDGVGYSGGCGGGLQAQSWRYAGSGFNNYAVDSHNVQPRINSNEQIRFGVCGHNGITGQVTQKSINGYAPNIEFFFSVRVTSYK